MVEERERWRGRQGEGNGRELRGVKLGKGMWGGGGVGAERGTLHSLLIQFVINYCTSTVVSMSIWYSTLVRFDLVPVWEEFCAWYMILCMVHDFVHDTYSLKGL